MEKGKHAAVTVNDVEKMKVSFHVVLCILTMQCQIHGLSSGESLTHQNLHLCENTTNYSLHHI